MNKKNIQGSFIAISGPSGVGKTLFLRKTLEEHPRFASPITYTTRPRRDHEESGVHYYFIDFKEFTRLREEGQFVEWAEVHKEWYGTSYDEIYRIWSAEKSIIKDLDIQGAKSIKKIYPKACTVFIYPPNIEELKKRLEKRGSADINNLQERLASAEKEMALGRIYDFKIVNDDFEEAWKEFKKIIEKY